MESASAAFGARRADSRRRTAGSESNRSAGLLGPWTGGIRSSPLRARRIVEEGRNQVVQYRRRRQGQARDYPHRLL